MKDLIQKYEAAKKETYRLYNLLLKTSDGFKYVTKVRSFGSIRWENHHNQFTVQELCDEYYGDNGIVDVYTNNKNHTIDTYGDVYVTSVEHMINISKEDISMSQAICNWINPNK